MPRSNLIILGVVAGAVAALSTTAHSQTAPGLPRYDQAADVTAVAGCSRPDDAKEAKVVELDTGKSLAKLAVNLGSGRFKLVRITVWDRPEDPRPLIPVIEAARITQGLVQFYTPTLNNDPESAHESFLLMVDMGGGNICWATPASLIKDVGPPVTEGKLPAGHSECVDDVDPGTLEARNSTLLYGAAQGALELLEVQPAGGRTMSASDWLRGHRA